MYTTWQLGILWKIGLTWKFMIHRWLWGYLCKERMMTGCTSCHGFNTRMLPWLQLEFGSERRNLGTFESSRTNSIHLYGWIILEKSHCDVIMKYYIHRRWLVGATIPNWAYLRLVNNCNLSTCMGRVQQEPAPSSWWTWKFRLNHAWPLFRVLTLVGFQSQWIHIN